MDHPAAFRFADALRPLAALGGGLMMAREGECIRWTYGDCAALATMREDGAVETDFIDAPAQDRATGERVVLVYGHRHRYGLDAAGCARLVDDLVAFFTGAREPRFAFVRVEAQL